MTTAGTREISPFDQDLHDLLDAELGRLTTWADSIGVGMILEHDMPGSSIFISDLGRHDLADPSSKGAGERVLLELFRIADQHSFVVETSHMTNEIGLGLYYRQLGFIPEDEPGEITNMTRPAVLASADEAPTGNPMTTDAPTPS